MDPNFLNAKFKESDDEDDEDYVPQKGDALDDDNDDAH
jgi:hypothetical protein